MKRTFIALTAFAIPIIVSATGWTQITGKNVVGEEVIWTADPVEKSNVDGIRTLSTTISVVDKKGRSNDYVNQICSFSEVGSKRFFACDRSGTSPLAGAKYLIRPDTKQECGGKYYLLQSGGGKRTPKKMYQEPWEC